jgi:hypothetical protein
MKHAGIFLALLGMLAPCVFSRSNYRFMPRQPRGVSGTGAWLTPSLATRTLAVLSIEFAQCADLPLSQSGF